jgi:hypothetical protein
MIIAGRGKTGSRFIILRSPFLDQYVWQLVAITQHVGAGLVPARVAPADEAGINPVASFMLGHEPEGLHYNRV